MRSESLHLPLQVRPVILVVPGSQWSMINRGNSVDSNSFMESVDDVSPTQKAANDKDLRNQTQQQIQSAEILFKIS